MYRLFQECWWRLPSVGARPPRFFAVLIYILNCTYIAERRLGLFCCVLFRGAQGGGGGPASNLYIRNDGMNKRCKYSGIGKFRANPSAEFVRKGALPVI